MAGIAHVFTISHVAEMLGEDEDWLHEISINMDPEDGLSGSSVSARIKCPAFTEYGIECLKQIIIEERALIARKPTRTSSACGAHRRLTLKQALILVEHDGLAAAILDHALGDGDSSRLCKRLKERDIPFVIYSGFSKIDGLCADGPLVKKPASGDILVSTVEGLLASKPKKD